MTSIGSTPTPVGPDPSTTTTPTTTTPSTPADTGTLGFDRFAGDAAFGEVLAGTRTFGVGESGPHVKVLEETLLALGYGFQGGNRANETLTPATRNAIARFQRDEGLPTTGEVDAATMRALDRVAAARLGAAAPATPTAPAAPTGPLPTDFVPKEVLEKHGLSTTDMQTKSTYEGEEWGSVGYYPYSGDVQYIAFGKHASVFGEEGASDAQPYFEFYSNPPSGLDAGSWIASGRVSESNFEGTADVDITGSRKVSNDAYRLMRRSGAPHDSTFALRDNAGAEIPLQAGDRLVPTTMKDGAPVKVDLDGNGSYSAADGSFVRDSSVVWRLQRDGEIVFSPDHKAEPADDLTGVQRNVKFDFLDATGRMVGFDPPADRIVESWKSGDDWHVLAKKDDGSFEHQTITNGSVASTETLDEAGATRLKDGQSIIHRVQTAATGALKGDGEVGASFNMGWWGKCHNVASLSTTNIAKPKNPVSVVTNQGAGDEVALRFGDQVLVPQRDTSGAVTGYDRQTRAADGSVSSSSAISVQEAETLASQNDAKAVLVQSDGSLKDAEVTYFDTESLTALMAHIGDGGVEYVGGAGQRYEAHEDILVMKDGRQIQAHIKEVKTQGGETHTIGRRSGTDYNESDRAELRSPGMESRVLGGGGRSYAFNVQDMEKLNEHRQDDIQELVVIHPDGREETIQASDVGLFAWENQFDFRPDELWDLHGTVKADRSTVMETYQGTQVWNYAVRDVETNVIDPATLSASERATAAQPGMMTGTVEDDGKVYFETQVETDGGTKNMKYWVRFDADGNVTDYSYLNKVVPDFVWTQHVKTEGAWTGMSQAPGVKNADIQRLYFASNGRLGSHTLAGGVISANDLKNAPAADPR